MAADTWAGEEKELILREALEHAALAVYYRACGEPVFNAWNSGVCARIGLPERIDGASAEKVLDESRDSFDAFAGLLKKGRPEGGCCLHVACVDGAARWLRLRVSTLREGGLVLTAEDVTRQHDSELSHAACLQDAGADILFRLDADLTADLTDNSCGAFTGAESLSGKSYSLAAAGAADALSADGAAGREKADEYYSRSRLLGLYESGLRSLTDDWRMLLPGHGSPSWVRTSVKLVADPYTGHIKAFVAMRDVTGEKKKLLDAQRRAVSDGLTGLYNRDEFERIAREKLSDRAEGKCLLILLDLDNLKGINDSGGHIQGDAAIKNAASVIKKHFRKTDISARVGGDEFAVFLSSVNGEPALRASVAALVREISGLPAGEPGERKLSCSVGCVFGDAGTDDFESMYKRADTALYKVKNSAGNDCAFYVPEMESPDYVHSGHRGVRRGRLPGPRELQELFEALSGAYTLTAAVNLSRGTYSLIKNGSGCRIPESGTADGFLKVAESFLPAEFKEKYIKGGICAGAARACEEGRKSLRFCCERSGAEALILMYRDSAGDVCAFVLADAGRP